MDEIWPFAYPSKYGMVMIVIATYTAFYCLRTVYRIYFHPLARFQGSIVAAASTEW